MTNCRTNSHGNVRPVTEPIATAFFITRNTCFNSKYLLLAFVREESHKDLRKWHKSPFVVVLNITLCSLDVNISAVRTTVSDKGEERRRRYFGKRAVSFAACPVSRTMDRSNAKLGEGVKHLF